MTCDDYLSMLATLPVGELAYGDARAHAAVCRDCDRVTRVVAERERNMMLAFGELYPPMPSQPIAAHALEMSRRRRIASYYRVGLGIAAAMSIFGFVAVRRLTPSAAVAGEVFPLRCLSTDQAIEMLRPALSDRARISSRGNSPAGMIEVFAPPQELQRVRSLLDSYDDAAASAAQCRIQVIMPSVRVKVR
jgi:hypothetical protein